MNIIKSSVHCALSLAILAGCSNENFTDQEKVFSDSTMNAKVIYGSDGRQDVYQVNLQLKQLADSTVALIKTNQLITRGESTIISSKNFGQEMQLCPSEKFREQNTAAFCSGFLVSPDTIVTAGHCIKTQSDCVNTSFVFGFSLKQEEILPSQIATTEVYRCHEITKQVLTSQGADFAIIKLDRTVTNHRPLNLRQSGTAQVGDPLVVIGHPSGLPTKITVGGQIRSVAHAEFIVANTDTYGGNSGSAVFNANTGVVEGILVRGEQDYVPKGNCYTSYTCLDTNCRGEDITKISVVNEFLQVNPSTETPTSTLPPHPPEGSNPSPTLPSTEIFISNSAVSIPDNNKIGVTSNLIVNSTPRGRKVLVKVNIVHPYVGDLAVKLIASDGQSVVLQNRLGGSTNNIIKTFDVTSTIGKVNVKGAYKLVIQDLAKQDNGTLKSWSIQFE